MNARIARKIVTCQSRFSRSWSHVKQARARLRNHKHFHFFPMSHSQFIEEGWKNPPANIQNP